MRKTGNRILTLVMVLVLGAVLTACNGSSITTNSKGTTFKLKNIERNDLLETTAAFSFDDGVLKVDLERGTVDVEVCSILPDSNDDTMYTELDSIYKGEGLASGDEIEINGLRGDVVVRVTGDNATGTVTLSPQK